MDPDEGIETRNSQDSRVSRGNDEDDSWSWAGSEHGSEQLAYENEQRDVPENAEEFGDAVSEGFSPPTDDENPFFKTFSTSTSDSLGEKKFFEGKDASVGKEPSMAKSTKTRSNKSSKSTSAKFKGKQQHPKMLKVRPNSDNSSGQDPEEEKLKLLPECCEFTARKNEYEDESRREMSVDWFMEMKISKAQQKQLCFAESLLIVEETGAAIGKMYCSVTFSKWADKECFCVHAGSYGKFSTGLESGTSITSFINFDLTTQQEFVHEWASQGVDTIERKTFIMNEWNTMPCKITLARNTKLVDTKSALLTFRDRENLICEGANIILQRLLILERRTLGEMTLQAMSYTGKVVKAKYEELGSGWENVKGKSVKTWGIRRTTFISEDEERTWDSLYNKNARLILRCMPDQPQALIPLWFESIIEFDKNGNFIGSYSPYAWACDMELYTKYTVKKEETTYEHRRYIIDHPEVRALLSDYLQSLLFRKPRNVLEFTQQYFESFLNLSQKGKRKSMRGNADGKPSGEDDGSGYYYDEVSGASVNDEIDGEWAGESDDSDRYYYPGNLRLTLDELENVGEGNVNTAESDQGPSGGGNDTEDDNKGRDQGIFIPSESVI